MPTVPCRCWTAEDLALYLPTSPPVCDYQASNENNRDLVDCNTVAPQNMNGLYDVEVSFGSGPGAGGSNQVSMDQTNAGVINCDITNGDAMINDQNIDVDGEEAIACVGLLFERCQVLADANLIRSEFSQCTLEDFTDAIILRTGDGNCMGLPDGNVIEQPDGCT